LGPQAALWNVPQAGFYDRGSLLRPGRSVVDRAARPDYKPPLRPLAAGSAQVAQLVEHATENRSVGGSIPPLGTIPEQICKPSAWVGELPLRALDGCPAQYRRSQRLCSTIADGWLFPKEKVSLACRSGVGLVFPGITLLPASPIF
jgi:hypothetical protein